MTNYVTSNVQLKAVCERASRRAFIMLDTEFVRTRTLTPLLGLIQLNDGDTVSLIDPTDITDFSPFVALLTQTSCMKVLHACSEDLETFIAALGVTPSPLFDTQFAAQLSGIGSTMGYANLVDTLLDVQLDKGESRTDWLARPLSEKQLSYAANDVIYLLPVFEALQRQMNDEQTQIVLSESALLAAKKHAQMPTSYAYLTIKNNWKLRGRSLLALQYLAKWRLERAMEKNMALNFVFKESAMVAVAQSLPTSKTALAKISVITPQELRMAGNAVVSIVNQALADAEADPTCLPAPVRRLSELKLYKPTMAKLKSAVAEIAETTGLPEDVLGSKKQLHQVLKYHWFDVDEYRVQGLTPDLMSGWRQPLFSPYISEIFN